MPNRSIHDGDLSVSKWLAVGRVPVRQEDVSRRGAGVARFEENGSSVSSTISAPCGKSSDFNIRRKGLFLFVFEIFGKPLKVGGDFSHDRTFFGEARQRALFQKPLVYECDCR